MKWGNDTILKTRAARKSGVNVNITPNIWNISKKSLSLQRRIMCCMEDVVKIASYICDRYQKEFGTRIDEMKLHKLLYFTQRECIAQTGEPMFDATFHAWMYGPVIPAIRSLYKHDMLHELPSKDFIVKYSSVFDEVFKELAPTKSVMLSVISHGELSWKRARVGYGKYDESDVPMKFEDIVEDALRYRERCLRLQELGVS